MFDERSRKALARPSPPPRPGPTSGGHEPIRDPSSSAAEQSSSRRRTHGCPRARHGIADGQRLDLADVLGHGSTDGHRLTDVGAVVNQDVAPIRASTRTRSASAPCRCGVSRHRTMTSCSSGLRTVIYPSVDLAGTRSGGSIYWASSPTSISRSTSAPASRGTNLPSARRRPTDGALVYWGVDDVATAVGGDRTRRRTRTGR